MFLQNFQKKSIKNFLFKNRQVVKYINNDQFHNILIKNCRNENEFKYKLHKWKKSYNSISKLNKVCMLTGRSRSIISPYLFKRQIFKINYMNNKIANLIKKK